MGSERLLGEDELRAFSLPPHRRLEQAAALGSEVLADTWHEVVGAYRAFCTGFELWALTIVDHIATRHGSLAAVPLLDVGLVLDAAGASGLTCTDVDASRVDPPSTWFEQPLVVLEDFAQLEPAMRRLHDALVDRVAMMLSYVYRTYGIRELEASLRASGDATLLRRLDRDISDDPVRRLRRTVVGLWGNCAEVSVAETDDEFIVVQDPCGTCGRQLERGRYEPDGPLAMVAEVDPLTFGCGGTPVYRCHVAVMHDLMPTERIGRPWPLISCPTDRESGPCVIRLPKMPIDVQFD